MRTAAVVLAAGRGSRFSAGGKLLAPFRGRPLVAWAVDAAVAAELDDTIVVVGSTPLDDALPAGIIVVRNRQWEHGIATSLCAAAGTAEERGHDAVVVGLADQPLVPASAWADVATSTSPIAVATYAGQRRNPVRLARAVWSLLPTTGDEGARVVVRDYPELVADVPCAGDPADVDTIADLEALEG